MLCFCKITDCSEANLFLQFCEKVSEDMVWPPPLYVLSLYKKRGGENDFESFYWLTFQKGGTFCIADKLNIEVNVKTEMLWKSSKYIDKRADSVCAPFAAPFPAFSVPQWW